MYSCNLHSYGLYERLKILRLTLLRCWQFWRETRTISLSLQPVLTTRRALPYQSAEWTISSPSSSSLLQNNSPTDEHLIPRFLAVNPATRTPKKLFSSSSTFGFTYSFSCHHHGVVFFPQVGSRCQFIQFVRVGVVTFRLST